MDNQGVVVEQSKARFVPFGYRTGADNDVEHNAFVIGLAGEEGAGLVAKLARDLKLTPYVWALTAGDVTAPQKRVAALYSRDGLCVYGYIFDFNDGGCAFGYAPK